MKQGYAMILAFAAAMSTLAQAPKPQMARIAIFDFESRDEPVHDLGPKIAALVTVGLAGEGKQCGFKLLKEASTAAPEVVISGEAFSALGFRKGNLISCKARIELKAVRANGEIAVVDRPTSVAVDITEQTAAKTALQNAAEELAERIIPRLAR
jgi:hypothetical protein